MQKCVCPGDQRKKVFWGALVEKSYHSYSGRGIDVKTLYAWKSIMNKLVDYGALIKTNSNKVLKKAALSINWRQFCLVAPNQKEKIK